MDKKTDNAHFDAKMNLRRHFLNKYPDKIDVLDCCQGSGALWSELRTEYNVNSYMGVDVKYKKGRLKIDSLKLMQPGLYQNVVDVDTYGTPWKHYSALVDVIDRPTTVFLTWGQVRQSSDGIISSCVGIDKLKPKPPVTCLSVLTNWALPFVLGLGLKRSDIVEVKEVLTSSATARYFGVRLVPKLRG